MRPFVLAISGVTVLALAGIFIGLNLPSPSSADGAAQVGVPTPTLAISNFKINGYADGPAKVVTPAYVPKTVDDPYAVADPYAGDSVGSSSDAGTGAATGSGDTTTPPTGTATGG